MTPLLALFAKLATAAVFHNVQVPDSASKVNTVISQRPCESYDAEGKDFDIVLFEPTSFTGKLVGDQLIKKGPDVKWVVAGTNMDSLKDLSNRYAAKKKRVEVHLVEGLEALQKVAKRARAIINFAHPSYTANVIGAAMQNCAHYVDISTNTGFNAQMMKQFGGLAEKRKLAIVQSAGFVSLASDLLASSVLEDIVDAQLAMPSDVTVVWTRLDGSQGGQMGKIVMPRNLMVTDPYILAPEKSVDLRTDWTLDGMEPTMEMHGFKVLNIHPEPFPAARVNGPVVRRSMHMKFPEVPISFHEAANASVYLRAFKLDSRVRNNDEILQEGSFAGVAVATGKWSGSVAQEYEQITQQVVTMSGQGDPETIGSSIMVVELTLGLLDRKDKYASPCGYLTPSTALGARVLEKRLLDVDSGNFITIHHGA